MQIKTST